MPERQAKHEKQQGAPRICPLLKAACEEDRCAWWVTHWAGTEHEYSECAIASLSLLNDISLNY